MALYKGRLGAVSYGHDVGILMLDCFNPFIPGDVGNAYTYGYPVLYKLVPELSSPMVRSGGDGAVKQLVEAAKDLQAQGVKAITSDCGYMLHYQDIVSAAVDIPVMLSSMLQLPFIAATIKQDRAIGIICANAQQLTDDLINKAFPERSRAVHVVGLEASDMFRKAFLDEVGYIDPQVVEDEVAAVARALAEERPEIGAILLECSNLPPYAHVVQAITGRPVFDFVTMINFMRNAIAQKPYTGGY